jgi:HD-like signal output (HDOD) protein
MASTKIIDPNYGRGQHDLGEWLEEAGIIESKELVRRLLEVFRAPRYEPPVLPAVAIELHKLVRKSDVKFPAILSLLEKDPLIAGKVLRIAQSAFYARQAAVQSIEQALVRLGLSTLSQLFMEVSMRAKVFRAAGYEEPMRLLSRHSAATAHIARILCRRTSLYDEYAFLCGLLHDVGIAASMIVLSQLPRGVKVPAFELVWPAIEEIHETASGILCRSWKLPPDVALVVEHHHVPRIGGMIHPFAAALCVSDALASDLGYGLPHEQTRTGYDDALKALGLDKGAITSLLPDARAAVAHIED